jgi:hypothetical protein
MVIRGTLLLPLLASLLLTQAGESGGCASQTEIA